MGSHTVYKQYWYIQSVHTLWYPILFINSTGTFSQCTRYGIPYCLQNCIDIKNHVLHALYCQFNSVNIMWSHNVCTDWMYQYYVLYLAWWWLNKPKHVAEFLILITNRCCVYWLNKLLYYSHYSYNNYILLLL